MTITTREAIGGINSDVDAHESCPLTFHQWLRGQDQWVISVAQSDVVYQAMKLAYAANAGHEPARR